jgi:hypothetical protein
MKAVGWGSVWDLLVAPRPAVEGCFSPRRPGISQSLGALCYGSTMTFTDSPLAKSS